MNSITIISQGIGTSGINRYASSLFKVFPNSADLIFVKFRKEHRNYSVGRVVEGRFPYGNSPLNLNTIFEKKAFSSLLGELYKRKNDGNIVHVASPHVLPIFSKVADVVTIHDIYPFISKERNFFNFELLFVKKTFEKYFQVENIVVNSQYVKSLVEQFGIGAKVTQIYPYVDPVFHQLGDKISLRKKLGLPLNKKLLLSVSTNVKRKNLRILPSILDKLGNNYKLVRVGPLVSNEIKIEIHSDEQLNELYNACDIFISPSLDEGFNYPVVEAMYCGLPLVLSDIPVHREVAANLGNYFDLNDINQAKAAVLESENTSITAQERKKIMEKYGINEFRKNMVDYYNNLRR
ncbi:MAG: glycosyltransferase family 1 protein [Candidatus Parvarchaeota archaeon]